MIVPLVCDARVVRRRNGTNARKAFSMEHKYAVGQIVELTPSSLRAAASGEYEIRQTMPAPDIKSASPRYRIRSISEKHDRIVAESELAPANDASAEMQAAAEQMQLPEIET
jgi:hypothetical protein